MERDGYTLSSYLIPGTSGYREYVVAHPDGVHSWSAAYYDKDLLEMGMSPGDVYDKILKVAKGALHVPPVQIQRDAG